MYVSVSKGLKNLQNCFGVLDVFARWRVRYVSAGNVTLCRAQHCVARDTVLPASYSLWGAYCKVQQHLNSPLMYGFFFCTQI
jgi:hypothetical protein